MYTSEMCQHHGNEMCRKMSRGGEVEDQDQIKKFSLWTKHRQLYLPWKL